MFCPSCGKKIDSGANFCPYCGSELVAESPGQLETDSGQTAVIPSDNQDIKSSDTESKRAPNLKRLVPLAAIIICTLLVGVIYLIIRVPVLPDEVALQGFEPGGGIIEAKVISKVDAIGELDVYSLPFDSSSSVIDEVRQVLNEPDLHPTLVTVELTYGAGGEETGTTRGATYKSLFIYRDGSWFHVVSWYVAD